MPLIKLRQLIQGPSGFSLTEIMLGGAILAGVGLMTATVFRNQMIAQRNIELDQKLSGFHSNITNIMKLERHCNATLKNFFPGPDQTFTAGQELEEIHKCVSNCEDPNEGNGTSFDIYTPGAYVGQKLIAVGEFIDDTNTWKIQSIKFLNDQHQSGKFQLRVSYVMNPNIGNKSISKDINLAARFSVDGFFRECSSSQEASVENIQKDLCRSLNFGDNVEPNNSKVAYWDDESQTCIFQEKDCSTVSGKVLDTFTSDGKMVCKPTVNATDANAFLNNSQGPVSCPGGTKFFLNSLGEVGLTCVP